MQKIKIINICCCLLLFHLSIAQNFNKIPDSLKRYSYEALRGKIFKNSYSDFKNNYIYARTNFLKAKNEDNIEEIIYGYDLEAEIFEDLNKSLKYSDSAISLARKNLPKALSYLYCTRGNLYYNKNRFKESLNCFLYARKDSTNIPKGLQNRINYSIGLIKKTQGYYEEAIDIYKKCEKDARINNQSNYLVYLFGIAELYNRINKIELSEKYTSKGIFLRNKDKLGEYYYPYFMSNKGKNLYKRKKYELAIKYLKDPLSIIKNENQDFSNYAENCFYIGECYNKLNQGTKAIEYYKKVDSIFTKRKDISLLTISAYNRIIDFYKKKNDYKQIVFYSDQFIIADKVLDDNYKYITSKIAKTYDIQKVIFSKQLVISSLKDDKKISFVAITILVLGLILLSVLFYFNNKRKKSELQKQKELFETYRVEREQKTIEKTEIIKKSSIANIDENVINQILSCLDKFEKEKNYLNNEYTIDSLATEFKTNSNYLSKVINEIKNYSFTQYINTLRIEYILEKLETDKRHLNYTIQALSEVSGFNSTQTFTRAFITYTKMKPSDFIKELKNRIL